MKIHKALGPGFNLVIRSRLATLFLKSKLNFQNTVSPVCYTNKPIHIPHLCKMLLTPYTLNQTVFSQFNHLFICAITQAQNFFVGGFEGAVLARSSIRIYCTGQAG